MENTTFPLSSQVQGASEDNASNGATFVEISADGYVSYVSRGCKKRQDANARFRRNVFRHCDEFSTRNDVKEIAILIYDLTDVEISESAIDLAHSDLTSLAEDLPF